MVNNVKYLTLKEFCKELSISSATGKNWIKLGKITPQNEKELLFSQDYIQKLKKELKKESNHFLKSRRNKNYISGQNFYQSYIDNSSENIIRTENLIKIIKEKKIQLNKKNISIIIANYAIMLFLSRNKIPHMNNPIKEYYEGNLNLKNFDFLIQDLIADHKKSALNIPDEIFNIEFNFTQKEDTLGLIYISLRDSGEKKKNGAYYTPINIVKKLYDKLECNTYKNKTFLDPCCGTGNFLLQCNTSPQKIYGYDIDDLSIKIARINIALNYDIYDKELLYTHIANKNILKDDISTKFDYIIGNPPWGYKFSEKELKFIKTKYSAEKNIESFDLIIEESLSRLKNGGMLSFVLPEAFLNVKRHNRIRSKIIQKNSIKYLEYLGNVFDKVMCPGIIIQIIHNNKPISTIGTKIKTKNKTFIIRTERNITAENFCLNTTDEDFEKLNKIENIQNPIFLKDNVIYGLGIVTGNNNKYLLKNKTHYNEPILKGTDINKFIYTTAKNYITYNPQEFQQIANLNIYRAKEKLIYKFISDKLIFAYDNKQTLTLNSCNILIPRIPNINIKYILAILNSDVAQFFFEKKFNSFKVLKNHLEQIPIPTPNNLTQEKIIKLVDTILESKNDNKIINSSINKLNLIINSLYKL